jgi:DNA-binding NarL/FixJ family response regulator
VNTHNPYVSPTTDQTTVLIAVQAPQVREALAALIGALEGFSVVAEAGTCEEAHELAQAHHPKLALVDHDLPPLGGALTIERLRSENLAEAIVAIGLRAGDGTRTRAKTAGAQTYVQTGAPPEDVLSALQIALQAGACAARMHVAPPSPFVNGNSSYSRAG